MRSIRSYLAGAAWIVALALTVGLGSAALAQSSGNLSGRVLDSNGGALPGAAVTVTQEATGYTRAAVSGADGTFQFFSLPAGTYRLDVALDGFAKVTQEALTVNVASTRTVDVSLSSANVEEVITVTSDAPLISTEPSIGTVVSQAELENLPLNGRQFANVAVLAPGTTLGYNADPTKPGQLVVQLNGGNGRNVNYMIDGGDNTDDTIGGALQNFNLDSVQEFKIQTMQYKAELGRSSGGVLSVVTKTGTNEFDGSVYGYFRDDELNATTETEKRAGVDKTPFEREQYGATIGGPIIKDKAHFFAAYEKVERPSSYVVFTDGAFPDFDGDSVGIPFTDELATAKATFNISAKQFLQVRYGFQQNDDKYGANPLAAPSNLGTLSNEYDSILLGHTAQVGDNKINEVLVQFTSFDNVISADSSDPLIIFPSGFSTGQNLNTPQTTSQRKRQLKDDFTWSTTLGDRRNDFKFGVNYIDEPTLGGDFTTGTAGQFTASENRPGSPITFIQIYGGAFIIDTPIEQYNFYVQDDIYLTDRLTLNVGVRYDLWQGFDLDQRSNAIWQRLSAGATSGELTDYYYQDFQGGRGGVLEEDDDNFGPRLGLTYDLKADGRHILRAGYGTYFDFPYTNATILFPNAAVLSEFGIIYQHDNPNGIRNPNGTLFQPGDPLPANQIVPDLAGPDEVASPTLATPYSDQLSVGYSWQVNDWLGLNFEAVTIDYHDIPFRFRPNAGIDADGDGQFEPGDGEVRRVPDLGTFRLWYGGGRGSYDGFNVGTKIRRDNFELQGFYTWSEAESNVIGGVDEFRLTGGDYQSDVAGGRQQRDVSINPIDPLCDACFGPVYRDAEHRVTLAGIYRAPFGIVLAGTLRYHSAFPYLEHANADLNGDGFTLDLRPGVTHVNSGRGASFSQLDARVSKEFSIGQNFGLELILDVFNLLNDENGAVTDRFGEPTTYAGDPLQGEQRLAQLGVRFSF